MSRKETKGAPVSIASVLRRFAPYLGKQRRLLVLASLAMMAEVALRLLEPWPLKFIIDQVIPARHTPGRLTWELGETGSVTKITVYAASLVAIVGLGAAAEYARRVGFALVGNHVLTECRADLFAHLQRLSLSFHGRVSTGDLATRLTGDVGRLQEVVSTAVLPLVAHALTMVAIATVMLVMEWRLAVVAFVVLPMFWVTTTRIGRQMRNNARRERERQGEIGALATEVIASMQVVQSLAGEGVHGERFASRNVSTFREGVLGQRLNARLLGTADLFIAAGTAAVLWFGARFVLAGEMTAGDLILFLMYHKTMTRPMRNLAKYSGRTAKALASAERIVEILDTVPAIKDAPDAMEAPPRVRSVMFEGVGFGYGSGRAAVDGVNLEARAGTITALVGDSGAGKSTLMNLLLRLYDPESGRILADGVDIRRYSVRSWRRSIAIVPQETTLFAATVRENIVFGRPDVTDEQVMKAARAAGAHEFIEQLPEGYATVLGERGATLSEGQRQRLAIARGAVRSTPILVFDEPTASLDAENSRLVGRTLRSLSRDRICFVITHDLRTVVDMDYIVCLRNGRVVEHGPHDALVARAGWYAGMLRMQTGTPGVAEVVDA